MALAPGTKLGPYQISSALGAGGMGEVYLARDTRLDRDVAIKILPEHLTNPDLKARFEREAKAISGLQHPHICVLFDVGAYNGTDYLVMEYLEGETLADRIARKPLTRDEAVKIAIEIASALEKAHRSGIIHRDLKPGNIMLTKSGAKLMDFGLAKPSAFASAASGTPAFAAIATMTSPASPITMAGTVIGTVQYMSPEQIQGKEIDSRSDIFAFGAVLYEMLTGKRAFDGKTQLSVASAILEKEPELVSATQPLAPAALDHVVKRALEKDPDHRWQSITDLRAQLEWSAATTTQPPVSPAGSRSLWQAAAIAASVLALALIALLAFRSAPKERLFWTQIVSPDKNSITTLGLGGTPVLSPDGTRLAFIATSNDGKKMLWVRGLDRGEARQLSDTDDAGYPFWSPDGNQIAFFAMGKLKRVDVNSGVVSVITDVNEGRGGAWRNNGTILIGARDTGLSIVEVATGVTKPFTKLDSTGVRNSHRFPVLLPDGKHYAFVAQGTASSVFIGSFDDDKLVEVPQLDNSVQFVADRVFFVRRETLFAQAYDHRTFQLQGEPQAIVQHVQTDPQFTYSIFSLTENGMLVYQSVGAGQSAYGRTTSLEVVDLTGKPKEKIPIPERSFSFALHPQTGTVFTIVFEQGSRQTGLWVLDSRGVMKRRLHTGVLREPVVSADGRYVVTYEQEGGKALVKGVDIQSGAVETLSSRDGIVSGFTPGAFTPDGRFIIGDARAVDHEGAKWEIQAIARAGEHSNHPLLAGASDFRAPAVSADGKWLTYVGYETGRMEVYISALDTKGDYPRVASTKVQVSQDGAYAPRFTPDGKMLLFTNPSLTILFAADLTYANGSVIPKNVRKLFDLPTHPAWKFYDIDAKNEIYLLHFNDNSRSALEVVTDWRQLTK